MKKILKGIGVFILIAVIALFAAPFLFKDKIKEVILNTINENLNAKVAVSNVNLSLFKSFPKANVSLNQLSIVNAAPFEGDTLVFTDELNLKMSINELFKDATEPLNIESFSLKNGNINIIVNKDGIANYDIVLNTDNEDEINGDEAVESTPLNLNIQNYEIENLNLKYTDEGSQMKFTLDEFNHTGKGNFAEQILDLETKTSTQLSFKMEDTKYANNISLNLDATLGIDLNAMKFTFKENKALINQLPLEFNGFLQIVENGQLYNLTFQTPTSDFKNFLGLIPETYAGNISQVQTTGEFKVSGKVDGKLTETTIPKFNIELASNNASFQYPDLPKGVQNIIIDTKIINKTGLLNDTFVNLDKLSFAIDQDVFNAQANIRNISTNPLINAKLKGIVNLANVTKAYPVQLEKPLSGILKADVTTKFDMNSVEKSQYQNIENSGTISLSGFQYESEEMAKPFQINETTIAFNPNHISLNSFDAKTGSSDLKVSGTLDNFYGFLFKKQELKGNFSLNSNKFVVVDLMSPTTSSSVTTANTKAATATTKTFQIPSFLNCNLKASAGTVIYDNLTLKNVSGNLGIKDQAVNLSNLKMDVFDGNITLNGTVSTQKSIPQFNMDLGLNSVNIAQSFTELDMLKKMAPIANVINGKLNSTVKLSGNLTNDLAPDLKTMSGDLFGQLLSTTVNEKKSKILSSLASNVNFLDLSKLNLNDLKASLSFQNGQVALKPTTFKYQDIGITLNGTHGFDQNMAYSLTFDVPAKYLGKEANALIAKLTPADQQKIENIPITANLTGTFSNPIVKTDMKLATANLVNQLVEMQKKNLINQGANALGNLLGSNSNNASTPKDSTDMSTQQTNPTKDQIKDVLGSLLGGKKKEE